MIYSPLIQKAITFAIKIHELDVQKKRKGTNIPYITHPLTVGLIAAQATDDENIISAAILHDTIEDCEPYGSVTRELIAKEFNEDVAQMVNDVTEQDKSLPWAERKAQELAHLTTCQHDSLLVKSADILHNLTSLNNDIECNGVEVFAKFNAPQDKIIGRYQKLISTILSIWPENPLKYELTGSLKQLDHLLKKFNKPMNIVQSAKQPKKERRETITLPSGKVIYKDLYEWSREIMKGLLNNLNSPEKPQEK